MMIGPAAPAQSVTGPDGRRHAAVEHAAEQFEAVMLHEMLKPLEGALSSDGEKGGAMQQYGVEAMAGALAHSHALGFAGRIVAAVELRERSSVEN